MKKNIFAVILIVLLVLLFVYACFAVWVNLITPNPDKNEILLSIEPAEPTMVVLEDDKVIVLEAPAVYKIRRAAYGDDCQYNLTHSVIYGYGEDIMVKNTSSEETYNITCQPLIGKGEIETVSKTVIVLTSSEISSLNFVPIYK